MRWLVAGIISLGVSAKQISKRAGDEETINLLALSIDDCTLYCDDPAVLPCTEDRGHTNAGIFLPYGAGTSDTEGAREDDSFHPVTMSGVPFFGEVYSDLFVSTNGLISFERGIAGSNSYTSVAFPINNLVLLTAFWSDLDFTIPSINGSNTWWYRRIDDTDADMATINSMIQTTSYENADVFIGTEALIATWHKAYYYEQVSRDRTVTIQAVVTHDFSGNSYAVFNFGDIEWTTGRASGGSACEGLGGTQAISGFNDGKGNYYALPESQTDAIIDIELGSNVGVTGRYIYKIDEADIIAQITINAEPPGVNEAMDHLLTAKEVGNHGCVCSALYVTGGLPKDKIDGLCREWRAARGCIWKDGGACAAVARDETTLYTVTNRVCEEGPLTCRGAACAIDIHYTDMINSMADDSFVPGLETEETCDTGGKTVFERDSCCGDAPIVQSFNDVSHACVGGSVVDV